MTFVHCLSVGCNGCNKDSWYCILFLQNAAFPVIVYGYRDDVRIAYMNSDRFILLIILVL